MRFISAASGDHRVRETNSRFVKNDPTFYTVSIAPCIPRPTPFAPRQRAHPVLLQPLQSNRFHAVAGSNTLWETKWQRHDLKRQLHASHFAGRGPVAGEAGPVPAPRLLPAVPRPDKAHQQAAVKHERREVQAAILRAVRTYSLRSYL